MSGLVEKMITVIVSGRLIGITGKREHTLCTSSGSEFRDIKGYFRQCRGYEQHMMESQDRGMRYAVFVGKENRAWEDLGKPTGKEVIRIVPVLCGSKRAGLIQTIVGLALVIASPFTGGATMAPGIGLLASGAAQLLSPQAKGLGTMEKPENRPSYSFNGPVNTTAQGGAVPLLYGRMIIGSAVISAGIYTEDQM